MQALLLMLMLAPDAGCDCDCTRAGLLETRRLYTLRCVMERGPADRCSELLAVANRAEFALESECRQAPQELPRR